MKKVSFKGYDAEQADNNHVWVCDKTGRKVMHASANEKLDEEGLKEIIKLYLKMGRVNAELNNKEIL